VPEEAQVENLELEAAPVVARVGHEAEENLGTEEDQKVAVLDRHWLQTVHDTRELKKEKDLHWD